MSRDLEHVCMCYENMCVCMHAYLELSQIWGGGGVLTIVCTVVLVSRLLL